MFGPTLAYTIIKLKVKCFNRSCDNVIDFVYTSDDFSPRMDGTCLKCGVEYSRKIEGLSDSSIISKTSEEVYR